MEEQQPSVPIIAVTAAVGAIVLLVVLLCNVLRKDKPSSQSSEDEGGEGDLSQKQKGQKNEEKSNKKAKTLAKGGKKQAAYIPFSHPWLASTLKGHSSRIVGLDFSPNGKYLISASEDRALMLWSVKEFEQKDHKYIRGNVELDSATHIAFSPDSRAFIGSLANENAVRIFRLTKKEDNSHSVAITSAVTFPKKHKTDIIGVGISSNGRFIMTCSGDTSIVIWDLKGEVLATIDTHQMNNSCGKVSPCGRFVASSGFTPDVKVWEVLFDKTGNFKEVRRAFELKGHGAGVYSFDFNNDSSRMASVSKDNTWKYWNTDVQYDLGQDAKLLLTGNLSFPATMIALSPDGRTVAVAGGTSVSFWNANKGEEDQVLEDIHPDVISCLSFNIGNRYLVTSGGKHINVLHNVTGYSATISELEEKMKTSSGPGMKERLQQQVDEARKSLEVILTPTA